MCCSSALKGVDNYMVHVITINCFLSMSRNYVCMFACMNCRIEQNSLQRFHRPEAIFLCLAWN